jgi:hypothetical protein
VAAAYYVMNLRISQKNQELMLKSQESSVKTQELALKSQQQAAETRQAQLFMQIFNKYYDQEFWKTWMTLTTREWKSYDDWKRDSEDPTIGALRFALCLLRGNRSSG